MLGVSPDSLKSHAKFKTKHDLKLDLAADEGKSVLEAYGVWVEKSMYGRKYMGVERSTFLIDRDGRDRPGLAQGQAFPATPRRSWTPPGRFELCANSAQTRRNLRRINPNGGLVARGRSH